jgi:hypothetical protein
MKRQISFAEAECAGKKRVTRRQRFLTEMDSVVPWVRLLSNDTKSSGPKDQFIRHSEQCWTTLRQF